MVDDVTCWYGIVFKAVVVTSSLYSSCDMSLNQYAYVIP